MQLRLQKIKATGNIHQLTAVKADSIVPGLADCPWPHPDSHCSPCTIYIPGQDFMLYQVWGEYAGDPHRKRFYSQTTCTDPNTTRVMRLLFIVRKLTTDPVPEGDGLFIGFITEAANNYEPKFTSDGKITQGWIDQWAWAGYLADLPTANEYYYICVDLNEGFWYSDVPIFLLFATDATYNVWAGGGYGVTLPAGLPLWQYNLNEPGQTDGWTQQSDYWHLTVIPYMQGGWPMIEGLAEIQNPDFPGSIQEGDPYNFSFDLMNLNAFPCGCPETLVWQIYDRSTGLPIHDAVTHLLDCGYTGVTFSGAITFTGGGIFYGQLKTGHKTNGQWQVDDTYDFSVVVVPYPCSHWTNATDCEAHGCWWWNGICQTDQPTQCSQLNNQPDCTRWDCLWWNNACHNRHPYNCEEINNQTDCEREPYYCYWYNGACHSSPLPPEICDWIDAQGGPTGLTVPDLYEIGDAYSGNTPPPGGPPWTFIPTVVNVYGVADYYLGFNGDAATGCDYF